MEKKLHEKLELFKTFLNEIFCFPDPTDPEQVVSFRLFDSLIVGCHSETRCEIEQSPCAFPPDERS